MANNTKQINTITFTWTWSSSTSFAEPVFLAQEDWCCFFCCNQHKL